MNNLDYLEDSKIELKFDFPNYTLWITAKLEGDYYVFSAEGRGKDLLFPSLDDLYKEDDIIKYLLETDYSNPLYKSDLAEIVGDKCKNSWIQIDDKKIQLLEGDILPKSWITVGKDDSFDILSDFDNHLYSMFGCKINLDEYAKGVINSKYTSCVIFRKKKYVNDKNTEKNITWELQW